MAAAAATHSLEELVATISNHELAQSVRLQALIDLRDGVESSREQDPSRFVTSILLPMVSLIQKGTPILQKGLPEQEIRTRILELISRLVQLEASKERNALILDAMLQLVKTDNEDNGATAIKIIIDVTKNFKACEERHATLFMQFVGDLYTQMDQSVSTVFSEAVPYDAGALLPSSQSFKVLAECPIATVLLYQSHKETVNQVIRHSLPSIVGFLKLQAPQQRRCHETARARNDIWVGLAPALQGNQYFRDFITAQVKTMSFLAYLLRGANETLHQYADTIPHASVRLLQDCPPDASSLRKELLVATRHILNTDFRQAFIPLIGGLLDERILLGPGIASQETLRPLAYSMFADMVHHVRAELPPQQLAKVIRIYSAMVQNPALSGAIQTMCAKLLVTLAESVATNAQNVEGASELLTEIFRADVEKLNTIHFQHDELVGKGDAADSAEITYSSIELSKPIFGAAFVHDPAEEVLKDVRQLLRTLLYGARSILLGLKSLQHGGPDAELLGDFFEASIKCLALFKDRDFEKEAMDLFASVWADVNPHIFQEVWTTRMDFFFEHTLNHTALLSVAQHLFDNEQRSRQLVSICLRHFSDRLDQLGDAETKRAAVTIRFMKMAFMAVTKFPESNEPALAPHLTRLIMDSFPLAAKSLEPSNYFLLLKGLFRAIGGGQGRFELLYKEVLPLLPEMLESLSKMLSSAEPGTMKRDLLIELNLTVPVRLAHLLKFLHYLMKPLVYALESQSELITQGLRTLELMVDNLTPEFLDPTLQSVLRELMTALSKHLRPVPHANHQHSHTIIRTLGKMGGRNRRLLERHPELSYRSSPEATTINISLTGRPLTLELHPLVELTIKGIRHVDNHVRNDAFQGLKSLTLVHLDIGIGSGSRETAFSSLFGGLFDALQIQELHGRASDFLRYVLRYLFISEAGRYQAAVNPSRKVPTTPLDVFIASIPQSLVCRDTDDIRICKAAVLVLIQDIIALSADEATRFREAPAMLHRLASRFAALCYEPSWKQKTAGFSGLAIMTGAVDLGLRWNLEREVDIVRALLFALKDMPQDVPRNAEEVHAILLQVIRVCNRPGLPLESPEHALVQKWWPVLINVLIQELASIHSAVRQGSKACIDLLASIYGQTPSELLVRYKERLLTPIFTKPLRALPIACQIGNVDAMTYCLSLDPPLPEMNEELVRLLQEALAFAEADDASLVNRPAYRQAVASASNLRVACIKLLTAAMPITEMFAKQLGTRQSVTSVYFKSLYSPSPEVKQVAHEGLKIVLSIQSRLPRELLQTGLRPILMNLAEPKRLSVAGLEGLARLLELLTNYFKVEIGAKLLDHFNIIAAPAALRDAAFTPLVDNEEIRKLVRLVNIFHLLPPTANVFLDQLIICVVNVEDTLNSASPSPFTEPLSKFIDRYAFDAADFFRKHVSEDKYVRTLRNVLHARTAPLFEQALMGQTAFFCDVGLRDPLLAKSCLTVIRELVKISPNWLDGEPRLMGIILKIWRSDINDEADSHGHRRRRHLSLILDILCMTVQSSFRVDLLLEMMLVYTREVTSDVVRLSEFLYRNVITGSSTTFQRNVLLLFRTWFDDNAVPWEVKTHFIRNVITPLIQASLGSGDSPGDVLDTGTFHWFHTQIWRPMSEPTGFTGADDALTIELFHLCSVLVHQCPTFLQDARKDIIKCAWNCIVKNNEDAVVKQCAYLLAARFFEAYESPSKFILSALTGLLRPGQAESRSLSRQALDILMPVLPKRLPKEPGVPQWVKVIRRILLEEGSGQAHHLLVYQILVRHRDQFFPYQEVFVPQLISILPKLGVSTQVSLESKVLSLDLVETVWTWERRANDQASGTHMDVDDETIRPQQWLLSSIQRDAIVSFLMKLVFSQVDPSGKGAIVSRSLSLLSEMLSPQAWNEVQVKLTFFVKAFDHQAEREAPSVQYQLQNTMKVLAIVANHKADAWYISNNESLHEILQKAFASDDFALLEIIQPILERTLRLFPIPAFDDDSQSDPISFHGYIATRLGEGLRTDKNLRATLLLLRVVVQHNPERVEPYVQPLMKLLAKFTKEHIVTPPPTTPAAYDNGVRILSSILEISRHIVAYLGDQRKILLTSLVQLVEKSVSPLLCPLILEIVREWILQRKEIYPTLKEKAGLVSKMQGFERLNEVLFKDYLNLVYDIYLDPSLRRTDLTVRLESSFLVGCRARDMSIRQKFMELLDASIPRNLISRLSYVLGVQSWEPLADCHWLHLVLDLLLGSVDGEKPLVANPALVTDPLEGQIRHLIEPVRRLLPTDPNLCHQVWTQVFPGIWSTLTRKDQQDLGNHIIILLSKEYHIKQASLRPNVVQTLLCGIAECSPPIALPPHFVKYLGRTFGAWHVAMEILQSSLEHIRDDEQGMDATQDSLAELYAELAEEDMFYGLWRRRSLFPETNAAIAYEQTGMWQQAQALYETAQIRSRSGAQPFSDVEFELWEDHWILAAQKLQQWDVLIDLAKSENNHDLFLECGWRLLDWSTDLPVIEEHITAVADGPTPRRRVFEALAALMKSTNGSLDKSGPEFSRIIDEAMQLSLRRWAALPETLSYAHVPLLQHFQQVLELQEAAQIFNSISSTTAATLEKKSADMKHVLQAWRERLPNLGDDISIWSDLVAWRQHVFSAINRFFMPFIQTAAQPGANAAAGSNTVGYRGYHETAWIINRFAHVARKHNLMEVCNNSLNKIYTLPNIEISEAFLKLREQARCHYQNPAELQSGLEVVNNTNLAYFSNTQKAEFYTLKAMFLSKLGNLDEANQAFAGAVKLDLGLPKAWAEWGKFSDRRWQENPGDLGQAASAVSCYLQAAGLYKSAKSRALLVRVLWLLSADDAALTVSRAFDSHKGDAALWYWIALIPQLLISLSHREAKYARYILLLLGKNYPQALFFHLRTTKEEMVAMKRAAVTRQGQQNGNVSPTRPEISAAQVEGTPHSLEPSTIPPSVRQPYEYIEEIVTILKTAFPLLALTMETFVDQIHHRFKATPDEDTYRFTSILVAEAMTAYTTRVHSGIEDGSVPLQCMNNANRFAQNVMGNIGSEFEEDVLKPKHTLREHITKLLKWRDRYERILDSRLRFQPLDLLSHWLVEFQHTKWEDIEIPGQYLEHKDNSSNFVKIHRIASKFEVCRAHGFSFRRLTLHGHDGTTHTFAVQLPSARHGRREERIMQLFRIFNGVLTRRKETRKRNIAFHLPAAVPFSPNLRLLENDASMITMQDIYDLRCDELGISREDPILLIGDRGKTVTPPMKQNEYLNLRLEVYQELTGKTMPRNTLTNYMIKTMASPSDLWAMRKQFGLQIASATFMTYVMCLSARYPSRFHISRRTGQIHVSEMLPSLSTHHPVFANPETVPFRLTPNMQHFLTPIGMDGLLTAGLVSVARALTQPEFEMDQQLVLFLRDEVLTWYNIHKQVPQVDAGFREQVACMAEGVVKRAELLASRDDKDEDTPRGGNGLPMSVQNLSNLISSATNPIALSRMPENYHAWF